MEWIVYMYKSLVKIMVEVSLNTTLTNDAKMKTYSTRSEPTSCKPHLKNTLSHITYRETANIIEFFLSAMISARLVL